MTDTWDLDYDVIVAGYGYAGGMAAITAHDAGARVAIFEKMANFGGNSMLSGGSCVAGAEYEATLAYLLRACDNATDREVLETFARGLVEFPALLTELAREVGFETVVRRRGGVYPFPGQEQLFAIQVTRNERYTGFPWVKGAKAGATLLWVLAEHVKRRSAIEVRCSSPVRDLVTDGSGMVLGVEVETEGRRTKVRARRAVVLCTGGFEHNARLISHHMHLRHAIAMSPLGNTGDGILMAQKVGAALWHMWHVHGGYGFRIPELDIALRHSFDGYRDVNRPMPWIAVDCFGRRFMNEFPPALQDPPIRALEYFDADIQDYPRIPCFLVFDDNGRRIGPIARVRANDAQVSFEWSDDNLAEVEKGYIHCADTVGELAEHLGVDPEALEESAQRWNADCRRGTDRDFRRPGGTMMPLETPPYYAISAWPIITNTQGGVVHNARQQALDPYGRPIPRLYKAGEMGSIFGHLYELAGNNTECFIGGQIAGRNAAAEPS